MKKRPWWLLPPGRINPSWWIALGAGMLWVDQLNGVSPQFPVVYALPVCLAAWYSGRSPALALALAVPVLRLAFQLESTPRQDVLPVVLATTSRGVVIMFLALWFARLAALERDLDRRVKVLEGFLQICGFCKSIRNEAGVWEPLESFISRRSEAEFSHGLCPSCGATHYPGIMDPSP